MNSKTNSMIKWTAKQFQMTFRWSKQPVDSAKKWSFARSNKTSATTGEAAKLKKRGEKYMTSFIHIQNMPMLTPMISNSGNQWLQNIDDAPHPLIRALWWHFDIALCPSVLKLFVFGFIIVFNDSHFNFHPVFGEKTRLLLMYFIKLRHLLHLK